MHPPDDLPRSPTGRVPAWVAEENAAFSAPPVRREGTTPSPVARRGLRPRTWVLLGVLWVGVSVALWAALGASGLRPSPPVQDPPPGVRTAAPPGTPAPSPEPPPVTAPPVPEPSAEVAALAEAAHLSAEGRRLFFAADPQLLGAEEFRGRCDHGAGVVLSDGVELLRADGTDLLRADGTAVGCFRRDGSGTSIVLYQPADARLHGFVVEAAAHETLHAAWLELPPDTRETLARLLEDVVAGVPADHPIHAQITGSVGDRPENRPTELFAYVGTQVWTDGGLHPELEAAYARYVMDRAALVTVHASWRALLDRLDAEIRTRADALTVRQTDVAQRRAQLSADVASLDHYRQTYVAKRAEVDAMTPEQRAGLSLGWRWWDGTELPMQPAEELLAAAAGLLARDEAAFAAREAALASDEVAVAQERTSVEASIADLQMLHAQLDPSSPAP